VIQSYKHIHTGQRAVAGILTPSSAREFSSWFGAIIETHKGGGVSIRVVSKGKTVATVHQGQILANFFNGSVKAFDANDFLSQFELTTPVEVEPGRRFRKQVEDDADEQ